MDIQRILSDKIERLPRGDHTNGLKAVALHIDNAIRHYSRGQAEADQALFTDSIYRCNQAFEGSIKEAYRVLAGKVPNRESPAQIERFLTSENVLRPRVLEQFTRYRTEWRNPSTHDHLLDFDEDEALLAITSVTAFAIVLCDQIAERLAFLRSEASTEPAEIKSLPEGDLLFQLAGQVLHFASSYEVQQPGPGFFTGLEGALAGFLATALSKTPDLRVLSSTSGAADLEVRRGNEVVAIELKGLLNPSNAKSVAERGLLQLSTYMQAGRASAGVLAVFSGSKKEYSSAILPDYRGRRIAVVAPRDFLDIAKLKTH